MAACNANKGNKFNEKRLKGFSRFFPLLFAALLCCSCINGITKGNDQPEPEIYYRPSTAMVKAVKTVLKKNGIQNTDNPSTEDVIESDLFGPIEVKKLGSCETRVTLLPQASKEHPLHQRFFVELDLVLLGSVTPPPPPRKGEEIFLPPKPMFIKVKGGGKGNIRSGPSTNRSIIARLPTGTPVSAYKREGAWYRIAFGGNRKGWAHQIILKAGAPKRTVPVKKPLPGQNIGPKKTPVKEEPKWEPIRTPPKTPAPMGVQDTPRTEPVVTTAKPESPSVTVSKANETQSTVGPDQTSPDNTAAPVLQIWKKKHVDVLEKPNPFARSIGTFPPGTRITRFKETGDFYRIDHNGLQGFVYKDFCEIIK